MDSTYDHLATCNREAEIVNPSKHPVLPAMPPPERLSNLAEAAQVARFKASPRATADKIRLGEHMLRRNPDRIAPYLLLAEHAPAPLLRKVYLAQAVSVGHRVWGPWLKGEGTVAWWTDKARQPFMTALGLYGVQMAHDGVTNMATKCLKLLLKLDPADNMGAVNLFSEAGLIHPGTESPTPGMSM
jgi:hypothetical protein